MVVIMWCREWINVLRMLNSLKAWTLEYCLGDAELMSLRSERDPFPNGYQNLSTRITWIILGSSNQRLLFDGSGTQDIIFRDTSLSVRDLGKLFSLLSEFCLLVTLSWPWTLSSDHGHVLGLHSYLYPFPKACLWGMLSPLSMPPPPASFCLSLGQEWCLLSLIHEEQDNFSWDTFS